MPHTEQKDKQQQQAFKNHSPLAALGELARKASLQTQGHSSSQQSRLEGWVQDHNKYDYSQYKRESLYSDVSTSVDGHSPVFYSAKDGKHENGQSSSQPSSPVLSTNPARNFSRPLRPSVGPATSAELPAGAVRGGPENDSNHLQPQNTGQTSAPTSPNPNHHRHEVSLARKLSQSQLELAFEHSEDPPTRARMQRSLSASSQQSAASSIMHPSKVDPPFRGTQQASPNRRTSDTPSALSNGVNNQEHLKTDNRWQNFFNRQSHLTEDAQSSAGHTEHAYGNTPAIVFSPPSMREPSVQDLKTMRKPSTQNVRNVSHEQERPPSVYSNYSYYDLPDSRAATPMTPNFPRQETNYSAGGPSATFLKTKHSVSLLTPATASSHPKNKGKSELNPDDPVDCCLLGIEMHENGDLDRAAYYLEKSARAGIGPGMLLWGLSLRHGWGVAVNPERGFQWIQKTAESVVEDLDASVQKGALDAEEKRATTNELVLAIYELGISFRHGWGVKKNKQLAVSYFTLAANLGDPDAMQELGFCYSAGKGCKKDMKKAATYYRMAVAAGKPEIFGSSWIYKEKVIFELIS